MSAIKRISGIRGEPEKHGAWIIQRISASWYVFPAANVDDAGHYYGAVYVRDTKSDAFAAIGRDGKHDDLRTATLALHEELASIEVDAANAMSTKAAVCVPRWLEQRDKLARFYDSDVFLDRQPVAA